ncbi:MAG: trypsin-like serine protease [Rhodoblastus sp.]
MLKSRLILFFSVAAGLAGGGAAAMVGPTGDAAAYSAHVVMTLAQNGRGAGFCSGVVLAPNVVLTAAHCVAAPAATRVHFRDGAGKPVLMEVSRVARHPGFRADAVAARAKSIDLALVETKEPLPSSFTSVALGEAPNEIGAAFEATGFGVTQPGAASTSGVLRRARLTLRAPLSHVLLWLDSADGAGACTGDSGAPVFNNGALVGIVAFAQGAHGRGCGGLTQAVRIAPYRAWIEQTIAGWR